MLALEVKRNIHVEIKCSIIKLRSSHAISCKFVHENFNLFSIMEKKNKDHFSRVGIFTTTADFAFIA